MPVFARAREHTGAGTQPQKAAGSAQPRVCETRESLQMTTRDAACGRAGVDKDGSGYVGFEEFCAMHDEQVVPAVDV